MRLPTATLLTACALSAALLVAGRGGAGEKITMPGAESVVPAAEGRVVSGDPFTGLFADPAAADPDSGSSFADTDPGTGTDSDTGAAPGSGSGSGDELGPGEDPGSDEGLGSGHDRAADPGEIGPETVPEVPDLPDGGGLIPDGPDESDALDRSDSVFGSPLDVVLG